ncbi:alkaline phosphatase [Aureimonas sp. SA4125]|uniref:esterase-like activity of phytase family protein n=1 Tax=Aureimonas sp. SA4125 TaxID=2826993 RepID=UPI001CC4C90B|nr:esterase-like activity of phytase family protein [Aureimonas sp. SA4125]BDA83226.1 alkaline phosphatase [Aureimonas sp. SA4125]
MIAKTASLAALLLASTALAASAAPMFNRVASFAVAENIPADKDQKSTSSSEIITATPDGMTLIYSDSPLGGIGFVDIADPKAPKAGGFLSLDGEPTSVTVVGTKALVGVNTSQSKTEPSGKLAIVDIATKTVEATCDLGGQPDSVAASKEGTLVAVAIENERDEDLNDGAIPQLPAGDVVIFDLKDGVADCGSLKRVDVTKLSDVAPTDPEPEFIAFNDRNEIVLSLQENNAFVVIDGNTAKVTGHFSAGSVDLDKIDTVSDGKFDFTGSQKGRLREPDAAKWLDDNRFVAANEGDYEGGSRSFTIWNKDGTVLYESGASLEKAAVMAGHYPDKRSRAKGIEPEGLEVGKFGEDTLIFVLAERASLVAVYKDTGAEPELLQLLPSGVSPEGGIAIPSRNLFVSANEADLGEDGGARSHVMIYERSEGPAAYPQIVSTEVDGQPIGWGALSGLAADPETAGTLYAVSDSFYRSQPAIFTIDATKRPAEITKALPVTRDGTAAQKLDIEGITPDGDGGFWLASEGDAAKLTPHALYRVNAKGEIKEEIAFPAELLAGETRFGAEGIAKIGDVLWVAMQREWKDDPKGTAKLLSYDIKAKEWGAVRYPLEQTESGWVGLSEITVQGDNIILVERDNLIGAAAKLKKLYRVAVSELQPAKLGGDLPTVKKEEVRDLMPDLKKNGGYVVDKVEGFAIDKDGTGYVVTDNDGVDDSSGETMFFAIGKVE